MGWSIGNAKLVCLKGELCCGVASYSCKEQGGLLACGCSWCAKGFMVCTAGKMAQDVGMVYKKDCGGVPILFGWFLRVPYLHVLVFN